jgi:hypothetical protein
MELLDEYLWVVDGEFVIDEVDNLLFEEEL